MKYPYLTLCLLAFAGPAAPAAEPKNYVACVAKESLGSSYDEKSKKWTQERSQNYEFSWNDPDDIVDSALFESTLLPESVMSWLIIGPGPQNKKPSLDILVLTLDGDKGAGGSDTLNIQLDANGVAPATRWSTAFNRDNLDRLSVECEINHPEAK